MMSSWHHQTTFGAPDLRPVGSNQSYIRYLSSSTASGTRACIIAHHMSIILQPHVIMHIYSFSVKMALLLLSKATGSSSNRLRHIKLSSLSHHQ